MPGKKSGEIAGKVFRFLAFPGFFRNFSRERNLAHEHNGGSGRVLSASGRGAVDQHTG
jgi:hypothetical protein